jgi:4-amino-4-deoxy-L-arabinose transferase-like glycosyltransferase
MTIQGHRFRHSATYARYAAAVAGTAFIFAYIVIALLRMGYPFELEWMEGGSLQHVQRILLGQRLYVQPSLEFVPYVYTPLYFYVCALFARISDLGFLSMRVVSFLSSLGCLLIIFLLVRRETRDTFAGLLAASLFAATFRLSGAWLDLARVDSLFLLLLLAGVYVFRFSSSYRSAGLAALLLWLAFLTKQQALAIAIPVIIVALVHNKRRGSLLGGALIGLAVLSTLILDRLHDGWYVYYILKLPRQHEMVINQIGGFWLNDVLRPLPVAVVFSALFLIAGRRINADRGLHFYAALATGMVGVAWLSRIHLGGYDNVLLPAYAVLAVLFGCGVHLTVEQIKARLASPNLAFTMVGVLCILQFAMLTYNPAEHVPSENDRVAGQQLVTMISQLPGNILIPDHGYLAHMAGKQWCAHRMAMHDVFRGDREGEGKRLGDEIRAAMELQRFSGILLDGYWRKADIEKYYIGRAPVLIDDTVFWPVTGKRTRPTLLYVPSE